MDPTYQLCSIHHPVRTLNVNWYQCPETDQLTTDQVRQFTGGQSLKTQLGRSVFTDYTGTILANIDILNLTRSTGGFLAQQTLGPLTYCYIGSTGGWISYIQWRRPEAYGYVIHPRNKDLGQIDRDRITIYYGQDNTGLIESNGPSFSQYVRSIEVDGVDLALSQEGTWQAAQTCLDCLKPGGTGLIRYTSPALFQQFSRAFDRVTLFRPLADSTQVYCVGLGYRLNGSRMDQESPLTKSLVDWINAIPDPTEVVLLSRAKAMWAIPDQSPGLTSD